MTEPSEDRQRGAEQQRPPLGSWNRMYLLVFAVLVVEIVLFSLFTWVFE